MAGVTPDELAVLCAELEAGQARLRENAAAMDRSLTALEQTTAELRQDVTRVGQRANANETRLERIELRLGVEAT